MLFPVLKNTSLWYKKLHLIFPYLLQDEHRVELEELFSRLGVDPNQGLSNGEAADRNAKYGDNAISGKKKTPWYLMLLKELTGFFPMLLWVGGILSLIAYALSPTDPSNVNPLKSFSLNSLALPWCCAFCRQLLDWFHYLYSKCQV
jgi:magnesium-transporting ATPase (P-type)